MKKLARGYTIIELVVIIAIISILAAVTIVGYTSVQQGARNTQRFAALTTIAEALEKYFSKNGEYPTCAAMAQSSSTVVTNVLPGLDPTTLTAPTATAGTNSIQPGCAAPTTPAQYGYIGGITTYILQYKEEGGVVKPAAIARHTAMPDTVTIGAQTWMKYNLDVGDRITGATNQTNNSIVEKYCYNNDPANCTTYGGLYQWDEAMQYGGAQDICPTGSHIPTDAEYKTLEMYLGMSQAQADADGWRGTTEGTQLKPGGTSGFNMPPAGYRHTDGSFYALSDALFWSSSESDAYAWGRHLTPVLATVERYMDYESTGYSVRCLKN